MLKSKDLKIVKNYFIKKEDSIQLYQNKGLKYVE